MFVVKKLIEIHRVLERNGYLWSSVSVDADVFVDWSEVTHVRLRGMEQNLV